MRYASLRQGLVGAWCPSVSGPYGYRLPDLSGYGNHGTLTNMDPGSDWVVSGGKGALDFDGSNDYVTTTTPGLTTSNMSVSLWFRSQVNLSTNNYSCLLDWGAASSYPADIGKNFSILFGSDANFGTNGFGVSQYGDGFAVPGLNDNVWHSAYIELVGSLYSIWIDGVFRTSKTMTTNTTSTAITIGKYFSGWYYNGVIDDIRIYKRSLKASEIRLLASERGIGLKPERIRNRYSAPATTNTRNRSSRFLAFPS